MSVGSIIDRVVVWATDGQAGILQVNIMSKEAKTKNRAWAQSYILHSWSRSADQYATHCLFVLARTGQPMATPGKAVAS